MSNIIVRNLQSGGGNPAITSFSDNFNRANTTGGFGPNWLWGGFAYTGTNGPSTASARGDYNISVNQASFTATAINQSLSCPLYWFAVPPMSFLMNGSAANSRNQFCELQFISSNSVQGTRLLYGAIGVGAWEGSEFNAYSLQYTIDNLQSLWTLVRIDGIAPTFTVLGTGAANSIAANDFVRLNVVYAVGQVELAILINDVQSGATVIDNGASQCRFGSPFMGRNFYSSNAAPGTSTVVFDNWDCGAL